jgi:ABC-type transport system involved in multi-copper enzyme maturation permease subunit
MTSSAATARIRIAGADACPNLARLTAVELRKMVDTRAGFWLQLVVAVTTVVLVVLYGIFADANDRTLRKTLELSLAPSSVLLPVVGILVVSSEWSQRTAQITFALVPNRSRVYAAKLAAGTALALVAFAVCMMVAAVGTAFAGAGSAGTWSLPLGMVGQDLLSLVTGMIGGVGFGALFLNSAPAIVANFAAPTGSAALGSLSVFEGIAKWLDPTRGLAPMTEHLMSSTEWARAGTVLALWMVLPVLVGLWRILRSEPS